MNNSCSSSWSWEVTQGSSVGIPEFHKFWWCTFPGGTEGSTPGTPEAASHWALLDLGCPQDRQTYCLPDGMDVWDLDGFKLSLSVRARAKVAFQVAETSSSPAPLLVIREKYFTCFLISVVRVFQMLWALHHIGLDAQTAGGSSYSKEWKENNELLEQLWPLQ